jgi:hypothetical protein
MNRPVVARTTPPPQPVPFARQQTALQSNPGRPLDNTALTQIQSSQPSPQRTLIRPAGVPQRSLPQANAPQGGGQFNRPAGGGQGSGQPEIRRGINPGQPPAGTGAPVPLNRPQQVEPRNVPPQVGRPRSVEQPVGGPAEKQERQQRRVEKQEEKRGEKREER